MNTFTILYDILMSPVDDHAVITVVAFKAVNKITVIQIIS